MPLHPSRPVGDAIYDGEVHVVRDHGVARVTRADPFITVAEEIARSLARGVADPLTLVLPGGVTYRLHSYDADLHTFKADRIDA